MRVGGGVRRPVRHRAGDPLVDPRGPRRPPARASSATPNVVTARNGAGPVQPAPHVAAEARVLRDRAHRDRVQRLEQQRAQPADEHRRVAVHAGDRASGLEPARPVAEVDPLAVPRAVRTGDAEEQRLAQPTAQVGEHRGHAPTLRRGEARPDGPCEDPRVSRTSSNRTAHVPEVPRHDLRRPGGGRWAGGRAVQPAGPGRAGCRSHGAARHVPRRSGRLATVQGPGPQAAKAQCGYLVVPLDYANPTGPTIKLAVSRILHTKGPYRGAAFANPGGPGGSALQYSRLGGAVPHGVGKTYDWYGMDPRGVGASIPALSCDPRFSNSRHRPYQPTTPAILSYWLAKTEAYAAACGTSAAKDLLPHLKTTDNVADFESLRTAIGAGPGDLLRLLLRHLHRPGVGHPAPGFAQGDGPRRRREPRPRLVPGQPRPGPCLRDRLQEVLHVDRQVRPHLPPRPERPAGRQADREAPQAAVEEAGPGQARRR